jgi:D-3-phosphoglycerate dehydrogenase / 2-oxoglutarate reductase
VERVLVSCPHLARAIDQFLPALTAAGLEVDAPVVPQQLSEEELLELLPGCVGIVAGDDPLTRRVIDAAPSLRVICKWGVGLDSIDLAYAAERGIPVINTPGAFADEVADVAIGYVVMLARALGTIDRAVRDGRWDRIPGRSLTGATLGIVGLGAIGLALARRAVGFGMNVLFAEPDSTRHAAGVALGATAADLGGLLRGSDFVSLNCALTPDTRHLIGAEELAAMKSTAYLVNTSRGGLIDQQALVEALRSRSIAGAALDVFETEPLPPDDPLLEFDGCVFGTHNGSNTVEAVARVNEMAVANLIGALRP